MKLIKKLFIFSLLVSLLAPAAASSHHKINCETIFLSDENTEAFDYEPSNKKNINPNSADIFKII